MKEDWLRVIVTVLFFVLKEPVSGLLAWKCVGEHSRRQAGTSILIVIKLFAILCLHSKRFVTIRST